MEKIKLTFTLLFLVGTMFGQTITKVDGVVLSYDEKTDTMKLLVPNSLVSSEDPNWKKEIRISKGYEVTKIINGEEVLISETFYLMSGRDYNMGSDFTYYYPDCDKCEYDTGIIGTFTLKHPPKGEYIITVKDLYNGKWGPNSKVGYILIK